MAAVEGLMRGPRGLASFARAFGAACGGPLPALAAMLILQCHATTAPWSFVVMVVLALPAWWRDDGARLSLVDASALAIALAFAVSGLGQGWRFDGANAVPVAGFVALVLLARHARQGDAARVVALLAVVALLQLVAAVVALVRTSDPSLALRDAAVPWLVVPNDLAWMACAWPWWIALARERAGATRIAIVALLALQLVAFVLFGSRIAIAAAAVGTGYALLRDARGRWIGAGALGLAAAATFALGKGVASLEARMELWRAAWSLFVANPVFGLGAHGFVAGYREWMPAIPVDPRVTPWPHSLPLELLAQWGVVGFVAVALALVASWRSARGRRGRYALAPVAIAFALVACVEASAMRLWVWMFAALLLAWPRLDEGQEGTEAP